MDELKMDAVDTRQQHEIEALKLKDTAHDTDLKWLVNWTRYGMRFVLTSFILWVIASSTIIFVLLEKIDKLLK